MDTKGYNKGVTDLPERLRLYAITMNGVTITLNREQALLMADDIERGIKMRSANSQTPQTPKPQNPKPRCGTCGMPVGSCGQC